MKTNIQFLLLLFLILFFAGCVQKQIQPTSQASAPAPTVTPVTDQTLQIIDVHTYNHFRGVPERTSHIPDTLEEYLKEMKDNGVVGAVAHLDPEGKEYKNLKEHNIIACAGASASPDYRNIEVGLSIGKYSCIKIYLGYIYLYASDPIYRKLYKLAEKYDVPVIFHTGDTYASDGKLKYSDPLTIDEVAVDFPKVRFVIAHCGRPWIESAAEVAYKNPNVWLDGSALLVDTEDESAENIDRYVVKPLSWVMGYLKNPNKLMFGTDWPRTDMRSYIAAFKQAIPREYWRKVFYENAKTVFRFPK